MIRYAANPPWVNRVLDANWDALASVAPKWMPVEQAPAAKGKRQLQEFGCGAYGCVLPTETKNLVLKVTTDPLEAHFIASALKLKTFPDGIVRYFAIYKLVGNHRGRDVYAAWREEATDVGRFVDVEQKQQGYDRQTMRQFSTRLQQFRLWAGWFKRVLDRSADQGKLLAGLPSREQWAFERVDLDTIDAWHGESGRGPQYKGPDALAIALRGCEIIAEMMENEPVGYLVGQALSFYLEHGLLLADVHLGNIGRVAREDYREPIWVITDPGHLAVTKPAADTAQVPVLPS